MNTGPDFETIGDARLCAWSLDEGTTRIQTNSGAIFKILCRFEGARRAGYAVAGHPFWLVDLPQKLSWVKKHVVEKLK